MAAEPNSLKTTSPDKQGPASPPAAAPGSRRLWILLASIAVYIILFVFIAWETKVFALRIIAFQCVSITVITAGLLYGMRAGIVAGILSLPLNFVMSFIVGIDWFEAGFASVAPKLAGSALEICVGAFVGWLRDLRHNLKREIAERKRAEEMLRQEHAKLDQANEELQKEIAEREQAGREMLETKEQLEKLMEACKDPIVFSDGKGAIVGANRAFLDMLGYSLDEVVGEPGYGFGVMEAGTYETTAGDQVTLDEAYFKEVYENTALFFETGRISNWTSYYFHKSRKVIATQQSIVALLDEHGEREAIFSIIRDITDQRRAELELHRAKGAAEDANETKSMFLANMSHEIRTPMNGVLGFADMMLESGLDHEQADFAGMIKRSGEALLSLINDILDFSKIEAGRLDFKELEFDLELLAYDACELISPRIDSARVELICSIGGSLPTAVRGDPHRYRQVLINLLGNAAKFTAQGEIELSLELEEEQGGEVKVHARVRDTGIGIPENKLQLVFEMFQQADSATTRKYGGTGLGLSICKKIAGLMGGDVWAESPSHFGLGISDCGLNELNVQSQTQTSVESKISIPKSKIGGSGSTFHFTAWLKQAGEQQAGRKPSAALAGKRALVADDNMTSLTLATSAMQKAGMRACGFAGGEEALRAFRDALGAGEPFDICVLDISMPGMSGYDLAQQIRTIAGGDRVPLLAFTASAAPDVLQKSQDAGFNGFLPKPVKHVKLLRMMARLLGDASDSDCQADKKGWLVTRHSLAEEARHAAAIMLVEDNPVSQKLAKALLEKAGYRVEVACTGKEAIEKFSERPDEYDLILMDVQMPEMNGLEATREIRKIEGSRFKVQGSRFEDLELQDNQQSKIQNLKSKISRIPIVAMTANAMTGDREKCMDAGMDDYIAKPIKREVVFGMLKKYVLERLPPG